MTERNIDIESVISPKDKEWSDKFRANSEFEFNIQEHEHVGIKNSLDRVEAEQITDEADIFDNLINKYNRNNADFQQGMIEAARIASEQTIEEQIFEGTNIANIKALRKLYELYKKGGL